MYSESFLSSHQNFGKVQFMICHKLFYETRLMRIRGETVKYYKRKARKSREEEQTAMICGNQARQVFALSGEESDADNLIAAKKQLEDIRKLKIQGLITRSRVRWYDEGVYQECTRKSVQTISCRWKKLMGRENHCKCSVSTVR